MSVYTELSHSDIVTILADYSLGDLHAYEGIAAGIENSNFFIETDVGRFVLTVFERMQAEDLPYFMRLMRHLASHGLPCPDVQPRLDGDLLFSLSPPDGEKKGCIVSCLQGKTLEMLNPAQLRASGYALAALHMAGADFPERRENPTGMAWLSETVATVGEKTGQHYGEQALFLLHAELERQQARATVKLPEGVIHGDLFCDNILFEGDAVAGLIDFYYAHNAPYVMDIAISLNAQAVLLDGNDNARMQAFLDGYQAARRLSEGELQALPDMLCLAALRFWVSRLYDALFPRGGAMTQTKDPEEYRKKLLFHRAS
ncbi:MAG TPA: homoserine kinase [Mariprofundaceae bacterium]|nr:homoserine kinase [Mariprofundaceae bacterium]